MRNLLEEFKGNHGLRPPTILGVREHVFTGRFDIISCDEILLNADNKFLIWIFSAVFLLWHGLCLIRRQVLLHWVNEY